MAGFFVWQIYQEMALHKYKEKRNFKETPEPTGGQPDSAKLRFVIQKHDASHLHYDFRLEMEGVLKSWAVPKGPSTDPSVKRLAMMVEDHPYDYRNFEGIIPAGYGAGTVMIWDEGFYKPAGVDGLDKKAQDKLLRSGLYAGKLHFILRGKKLKGEYALVKTKGREANAWLLFKVKDQYVSEKDITLKDKSVISKKTIDQLKKTSKNFFGSKKKKRGGKKIEETEAEKEDADEKKVKPPAKNAGRRASVPAAVHPMLATLVDQPFDNSDWVYEIKWDGYRTVAFCKKKNVALKSRNDKSFDERFYPVHNALQKLNIQAVLDGEIVVLDENGKSDFGALQNWRSEAGGALYYYVFDLLWLNGRDLMKEELTVRRSLLEELITGKDVVRLSESFSVSGLEFFKTMKKMGLEGMVAKKKDSIYAPGFRSKEWLKIKVSKRQEMVIGGYTKRDNSSRTFSSLLMGVFKNGKLKYTGKVGTGFNDAMQKDMMKKFGRLVTSKPPFEETPDVNKPMRFRPDPPHATAVWLKPKLVCEVSFTEMTADGIMRHPSFEGMRTDKEAKEVLREKPVSTKKIVGRRKRSKG